MAWFRQRRRVWRSRLSAAVLVMAVLAGCDSTNPSTAANSASDYPCRDLQAAPLKVHVHPNGLQLSVSESCQVTTTPVGFVIEPPNAVQLRNPFVISVVLMEAPPKARGHRVHYTGSGRFLW